MSMHGAKVSSAPKLPSAEGDVVKGQGINSVPIRFGLLALALGLICGVGQALVWQGELLQQTPLITATLVFALIVIAQAGVTYFVARKFARNIQSLQESTDAIAAGNLDRPIDLQCSCEVGGLADSFRSLVNRLNSDLRRKNMLAHRDALTGLPNRAVLTHMLECLVAAEMPGTVMFIDLCGFKKVNDAFGYRAGDQLLYDVGSRLSRVGFAREIDQLDWGVSTFGEFERRPPRDLTLARFAADQFVVLLPGVVDLDHCERHAKGVLQALNLPFDVNGTSCALSAHLGIARVPLDSRDPSEILRFADLAMMAAKAERKPWRLFCTALSDGVVDRSRLESDLRQAIVHGEIELYYQPQVDGRTGRLCGVEALARWPHPARGMISPKVFIPLAEQAGLMSLLGSHVLRSAVRQCAEWQRAGRPRRVAINISAAQFDDPNFVRDALAAIAEYGADPTLIEIEITESMAMSDLPAAHQSLIQLRESGVQIAVDDFGTGFSNLSQLARLPFTTLKIDQSLIEGLGCSRKGEVLVKTIVTMAEGLGHTIVAEGVETLAQKQWLEAQGCYVHQGFLFARPMPAAQVDQWSESQALDGMIGQLQRITTMPAGERRMRMSALAVISHAG